MKKRLWLLFVLLTMVFPSEAFAQPSLEIPILMYHDLSQTGPFNAWVLDAAEFEKQMQYLRDNGFTALLPQDIVDISMGHRAMPVRPIMITFDDGYQSNYTLAFPILKKTGMKATISVIASLLAKPGTAPGEHMSWMQCKQMRDSGIIEIGSHTYDLHNMEQEGLYVKGGSNGIERKKGEGFDEYVARVGGDLQESLTLIEEYTGRPASFFAYPFGATDTWFVNTNAYQSMQMTVTTKSGIADLSNGAYLLPRLSIGMEDMEINWRKVEKFAKRTASAVPSDTELTVDSATVAIQSLLIDKEQYVDIEGLSAALKDTPAEFSCSKMEGTSVIIISHVKNENSQYSAPLEARQRAVLAPVNTTLIVDGEAFFATSFTTMGRTYFRMEDIAPMLGLLQKDGAYTMPAKQEGAVEA